MLSGEKLAQNSPTYNTDIDTQLLSDFIYDLNIARRQLTLYPEGHPQIASSCAVVLGILERLCQFRDEITLGIAPDALVFEQSRLDEQNPVYRDFARFMSSLDVASISFHKDLTAEELINYSRSLKEDNHNIAEAGGLHNLLKTKGVKNIRIESIDYSHFQQNRSDSHNGSDSKDLWDSFINGLIGKTLDQDGEAISDVTGSNEEILAQMLNSGKQSDYDQLISQFIAAARTKQPDPKHGERLKQLTAKLGPDVKRNFLNSTFQTLNRIADLSTEDLLAFPPELLTEALEQQNREQSNISSRLIDLLGQFSSTAASQGTKTVSTAAPLDDEIVKARIDIMLLEDNHDEYVPSEYQRALEKILDGRIAGDIAPAAALKLKASMERQSVERQCCAILFNMLEDQVDQETEILIQDNLAELARFFLDTGDFISLKEIFTRWSNYLYSGRANARYLDEKVLADQTRTAFIHEVLDSFALWKDEKYDEICSYIHEVGEAYAEELVERLADEEQMSLRKTWMKLLVELGNRGHQIIMQKLDDERWYLVRNLLIVLGRQREAIPTKAAHKLAGHHHPRVRQEALRILFKSNPATANRLLLKELSGGHDESICAAAQIADLSDDPKILHQLHQLLQTELQSDEDLKKKKQLLDALALIGKPESIPVLAKLLKKKGFIRSRRQKEFHAEIIKHLGAFPQQASEPLLNSVVAGRDRTQSLLARNQLNSYKQPEGRA